MAIASLIIGMVSIIGFLLPSLGMRSIGVLMWLYFFEAVVAGLVLGVTALIRKSKRGIAFAGTAFSGLFAVVLIANLMGWRIVGAMFMISFLIALYPLVAVVVGLVLGMRAARKRTKHGIAIAGIALNALVVLYAIIAKIAG